MHILSLPFFFLAKRIGAPYGEADGTIRLVSRNNYNYAFSSSSSTLSKGYNFRLGGAAASSFNGILCSKFTFKPLLSIGNYGSANTVGYYYYKLCNFYVATF